MKCLPLLLVFLLSVTDNLPADVQTVQLDWEPSCGGSLITVTLDDGKPVLIEASAEHFAEAREWTCLFNKNGKIVSALYRQHALTRRLINEEGDFAIDRKTTRVEVFTATEGVLQGLDEALKKDLEEVLHLVKKGVQKDE